MKQKYKYKVILDVEVETKNIIGTGSKTRKQKKLLNTLLEDENIRDEYFKNIIKGHIISDLQHLFKEDVPELEDEFEIVKKAINKLDDKHQEFFDEGHNLMGFYLSIRTGIEGMKIE